jgi:WhiB family redox-sensing transcriptional regulator
VTQDETGKAVRSLPLCREYDPELWFSVGTSGPALIEIEQAKSICRACPLRHSCLDHALRMGVEFGVWGGYTPDERRAMLRRNAIERMAKGADHRDRTELVKALGS